MPPILRNILVLHWAASFSLLAFVCVVAGDDGAIRSLRLLGMMIPFEQALPIPAPLATAVLSLGFSVCGVLFWWAFATLLLTGEDHRRDQDDIVQMAFAAATGTVTMVLLFGAVQAGDGFFQVVAVHLGALLASYIAVGAGRPSLADDTATHPGPAHEAAPDRTGKAMLAATLIRFSARSRAVRGEGR